MPASRGEPAVVIAGAPGAGKTTLARALAPPLAAAAGVPA